MNALLSASSGTGKLIDREVLRRLHRPSWAAAALFTAYTILFFGGAGVILWLVYERMWFAVVPLVLIHSFAMHAFLIAFHEAAHGSLAPWPPLNEFLGRLVGVFAFMSLTLYRAAHHGHHAYLGDMRDEEFWPLNDPAVPRWQRRLAAFAELFFGLAWTPLLFFRAFIRRDTLIRDRRTRWMIWAELAAPVLLWGGLFVVAILYNGLPYYLAAYLIPAWLAGNAQSLRKYIEHVGLTGTRIVELTRSIRSESAAGRTIAFLLFNEPFHDVHHLYPRLPQEVLPEAAEAERVPPEVPMFAGYGAAFRDMAASLGDPRFGRAWADAAL